MGDAAYRKSPQSTCRSGGAARSALERVGRTSARQSVQRDQPGTDKLDTLGIEPRAFRMQSGCDTATPCAHMEAATPRQTSCEPPTTLIIEPLHFSRRPAQLHKGLIASKCSCAPSAGKRLRVPERAWKSGPISSQRGLDVHRGGTMMTFLRIQPTGANIAPHGLMDEASKFESKERRLESHGAPAVKWIGGWGADLLSLAGLLAEGAESVQR